MDVDNPSPRFQIPLEQALPAQRHPTHQRPLKLKLLPTVQAAISPGITYPTTNHRIVLDDSASFPAIIGPSYIPNAGYGLFTGSAMKETCGD